MTRVFELVDKDTAQLIHEVLSIHHEALLTEKVTVQAVFASEIDEDGEESPVLKHHGYPALAKIQVTSYVDRVRGIPDAKLTIDRCGWKALSRSRQEACVDHELTHLTLTRDKEGRVRYDDLGRPKLRLRIHDWELSGFAEVVDRHGEASIESLTIGRFQETYGQLCLFPLPGLTEVKATRG